MPHPTQPGSNQLDDASEADGPQGDPNAAAAGPTKVLTPEAQRALAEAEARRKAQQEAVRPAEYGGQGGPDPVRYGDWEKGGIASDF